MTRWTEQEYADLLQKRGQEPSIPFKPTHTMPRTDGMNKLESRYAREVLDIRQMAGEILSWKYEAIKLRLAKRTYYTPDFMVFTLAGLEIHETKGHWEDDARVKIKVAAEMFPEFKFVAVQHKKGIWIYEAFPSRNSADAALLSACALAEGIPI